MIAEILDFPPVSGSVKEIHFSDYTNDVLWVSFTHETDWALSWVGTFQLKGDLASSVQLEPLSQDRFLILIKGRIYFIDALKQALYGKSEDEDIRQFFVLNNGTVLATNGLTLSILSPTETVWKSRRFAFDGVELSAQSSNLVLGTFDDGSDIGSTFKFDPESRTLACENEIDFAMFS